MAIYKNAYKGRANRQESATHLSDEFDRIAQAFVSLQERSTAYIDIYDHAGSSNVELIDPANGQMQQITLTQDTLIQIKEPLTGSDATTHRLSLIVHGANLKIINGWGPQTWKEQGSADWLWIYTGMGAKGSAVLEFCFDGKAWVCAAFSRNENFDDGSGGTDPGTTQEMFPLISDLVSENGTATLTWVRSSYGYGLDEDGSQILSPANQARFTGARYARNWIATSKDLKSDAWVPSGATVGTEAGGGQDGGDADKITFDVTHGELQHWMLLHFGRSAETSSPIKFAITFDAKMSGVVTSGTCRAVIAIMGVDTGATIKWDRETFNLTDTWQTFGAILDPITGKDPKGFDLSAAAGGRTLTKFAIESPADGVGNPIVVENVNIVVLKDGEAEKITNPIESTIGSSLVLTATGDSTGTWVDGTKTMTLALGENVDFQDSLEIGESYLCVLSRTNGNTVDVLMDDDRTFWKGYSKTATDTTFVKDGPFTFQYDGGVFRLFQATGNSVYSVNIYKISDQLQVFGTVNANTIDWNGVVTFTEGGKIASGIVTGAGYELDTGDNLLPTNKHRDFSLWSRNVVTRTHRGEVGIDARPSKGSIIEDYRTSAGAYIYERVTIPNDSLTYTFSVFVRQILDALGKLDITKEWDGTTTQPSQYMDISLQLTGGTVPVGGQRVRLELKTGTQNTSSNTYQGIFKINFVNWWALILACKNNGTGNTIAEMRIYPASSNKITETQTVVAAKTGYIIADWAQLETSSDGFSTSPCIPGDIRAVDSITTALSDGILYDAVPAEVGDVTGGLFNLDVTNIWKNITWIKS